MTRILVWKLMRRLRPGRGLCGACGEPVPTFPVWMVRLLGRLDCPCRLPYSASVWPWAE